jgi:hypothetical protein
MGEYMDIDAQKYIELHSEPLTESGCWIFDHVSGPVKKNGEQYGYAWYCGKLHRAHRLSYVAYKGNIPHGKIVSHTCDIPSCVNPDHLKATTQSENIKQAYDRDRKVSGFIGKKFLFTGSKNGNSRLQENDVMEIKIYLKSMTVPQIADKFKVSEGCIYDIKSGKNWSQVL